MGRPREYNKELRDKLIQITIDLLKNDKLENVSLRKTTKKANTSTNAIYTLFGSQEALFAETIEIVIAEKINQFNEENYSDVNQFVESFTEEMSSWKENEPALYELCLNPNNVDRINNPRGRTPDVGLLLGGYFVEKVIELSGRQEDEPSAWVVWYYIKGILSGNTVNEGALTAVEVFDKLNGDDAKKEISQ